ncbi:MAG: hypothetical protein ACREFJ_17630 [Acetobacteraceae bacterium]
MSGNGADLGQVIAMLGDVLRTQGDVLRTQHEQGRQLEELATGLTDLRQAVGHYHASVLGHGILITELDARVRRIEEHLKLPPMAA